MALLEIVDIDKEVDGQIILNKINLGVNEGEFFSLLGSSGCGKTTLLRLIAGLDKPSGGQIHLDGKRIDDMPPQHRPTKMVFQKYALFPHMTVFDNVAFGLRLNSYKGTVADKVEDALKRAALWDEVKDKLNKSGLSLSGGQQQRLCIARAIATEPAVLLMDEPCSALDPIATRRIEELMVELKTRYTIAIVTHNLQQAQRVADNTAFLYVDTSDGGRCGYLVEYGSSEQVFKNPREQYTKEYISGEFS